MYDKKTLLGGGCKASKNNSFDHYTYVKTWGLVHLVRLR